MNMGNLCKNCNGMLNKRQIRAGNQFCSKRCAFEYKSNQWKQYIKNKQKMVVLA